jgi:hypothetical protein
MTIVNWVRDERNTFSSPAGSYQQGWLRTRNSVGQDRTPADKLAGIWPDHSYDVTYTNVFWGSYKVNTYTNFGQTLVGSYQRGDNGSTFTGLESTFSSSDDLVALGRLAGNIRLHDWNAGIFVGEIGKTTDLIADRTRQLARAASSVKRGKLQQALTILKSTPSEFRRRKSSGTTKDATWYGTWLELRYAWRPLVKDIFDLSEAIRLRDAPRKTVVRSSYTREVPVRTNVPIPPLFTSFYKAVEPGRISVRYKYIFTEPPLTLATHLGLVDPSEIVWELVPLSFVADWFIPLGNYIRTRNVLSRTSGTAIRTIVESYDVSSSFFIPRVPSSGISGNQDVDVGLEARSRYKKLSRVILSSLQVPFPSVRNPIGANPATRLLDAIALARAVFGPR